MIVGTAGHIDHGKTALIKALTGVDASRLAEEQRRGITIDLGYAFSAQADGLSLGFVDVPGHERFIHNMLAGATGIDYALLVVAADDGIMPQTREHLAVLQLLAIKNGAVVVTKIDRVDAARLAQVRAELQQLLSASFLAGATLFEVCNLNGNGIEPLRQHLLARMRSLSLDMSADRDDASFRLAIDRVFTLAGIGTVVTGTAHSGRVCVGDSLMLAPTGQTIRVRSLHAQNQPAQWAGAGQRCALNISGEGLERDHIVRGHWLIAPPLQPACDRFDATLAALPTLAKPLTAWHPVHLHHGASDVLARVVPLSAASLAAGGQGLVQIVLEQPIHAQQGDRFVLRDQGAQTTIGGGEVLDIAPPQRKRRSAQRLSLLHALCDGIDERALIALAGNAKGALSLRDLAAQCNRSERQLRQMVAREPMLITIDSGDQALVWERQRWHSQCDAMLNALAAFHQQFADELGCERDRLRRIATPWLDRASARLVQDALMATGQLVANGPWLHLPQHKVVLAAAEVLFRNRALALLHSAPMEPPWLRELASATGLDEKLARNYMLRLVKNGDVYQVVKDLFFSQAAFDRLTEHARLLQASEGAISAARFRDVTGVSRKRAIQILEHFDRIGLTRRIKDLHTLRQ